MSVLNFLKSGAAKAIPSNESRCQHHYANRSRCTKSIAEGSEFFCRHHIDTGQLANSVLTGEEREADLMALRAEIMGRVTALDSADAVNHVLSNLFCVYLEGRISQTKVAQLTSVCRSLLSSIRLKREEAAAEKFRKCFIRVPISVVSSDPSKLKDNSESGHSDVAPHSSAAVFTDPPDLEGNSEPKHSCDQPHTPARTETAEGSQTSAAVFAASDNDATASPAEAHNHKKLSPDSSSTEDPEPSEASQESTPPTPPADSAEKVETNQNPDEPVSDPEPCPPSSFGSPALRRKRRNQ